MKQYLKTMPANDRSFVLGDGLDEAKDSRQAIVQQILPARPVGIAKRRSVKVREG